MFEITTQYYNSLVYNWEVIISFGRPVVWQCLCERNWKLSLSFYSVSSSWAIFDPSSPKWSSVILTMAHVDTLFSSQITICLICLYINDKEICREEEARENVVHSHSVDLAIPLCYLLSTSHSKPTNHLSLDAPKTQFSFEIQLSSSQGLCGVLARQAPPRIVLAVFGSLGGTFQP